MIRKIALAGSFLLVLTLAAAAQNSNSSIPARPRTTSSSTPAAKPATTQNRSQVSSNEAPETSGVMSAFNALLQGIRKADASAVMSVYWNSPKLILFNNNGTVTKGWDQVRRNRQSSYPDLRDVKLEVHDVSVNMLGRDGALVSCLWTQSQVYKGTPETASGRMTLVFKRVGNAWKAIHLHTSPDKEDPSRVPPSERVTPSPSPSPSSTPSPPPTQTPTPSPSPTPTP